MAQREVTKEEWFHLRTMRGANLTGYAAHRTRTEPIDPKNPTFVRSVGKTYYWPWGEQPDKATIKKIARRCPINAAQVFLKHYEPRNKRNTYATPVRVA
jgi:hypothetical protein